MSNTLNKEQFSQVSGLHMPNTCNMKYIIVEHLVLGEMQQTLDDLGGQREHFLSVYLAALQSDRLLGLNLHLT